MILSVIVATVVVALIVAVVLLAKDHAKVKSQVNALASSKANDTMFPLLALMLLNGNSGFMGGSTCGFKGFSPETPVLSDEAIKLKNDLMKKWVAEAKEKEESGKKK